jgi:Flp pilus assembly protein TadD
MSRRSTYRTRTGSWHRVSILPLLAVLAGCSTSPNGGVDLASIPQSSGSRFSIDDVASSEGAPRTVLRPGSGPGAASATASQPRPGALATATQPAGSAASGPLAESRQLRQSGQKAKALALLDNAAQSAPQDIAIMRERGLLALETGALEKARTLLKASADAGPPDWRVHSGLGAALAASGQQAEAQLQFARALELAPDHPAVLNNLALSYALDGRHEQAEKLLRRSAQAKAAKAETKQNLALILALKGQTEEARRIAEASMPPAQARSNIEYVSRVATVSQTKPVAAAPQVPQRAADARSPGDTPIYRLGGPGSPGK